MCHLQGKPNAHPHPSAQSEPDMGMFPPMVVPTPCQLQETTNHQATAWEGQQRFRHCGLNLLQPEPRGVV